MKLLHLDSSALGATSISRELSAAIVAQQRRLYPEVEVTYRDLDRDPIPHLTAQTLAQTDPAEAAAAEAVMQQFLQAEVIVIGAPMYNFAIPSTLKAWIDRIAVAGRTFHYTANGPEGLAGGKRLIIASARGGVYAEPSNDFQEPYLRQLFGFLGIDDITLVRAEGVAYSPQHRADALAAALAGLCAEQDAAVMA
ncbi:FMN-dependent NADH-azoreductase [Xanthomonas oryzae]|uniref:FMN-dependent NADH:quinone oxidoreductase n=1 Tax=Xanthomonas oryzae pv. oryzae (strain MAFF 311018) TaxID=342109 RepID=AZOR_XANOM|nr:NAD(P)H-dependent oxidoreductase [Xanthomonas oryzae]Q2P3X9.1 RecName: Full=FMN-dependent NADH:quinone oxidoreductase; AltName: Full=Azo-dye reductase; AltName: Full=FMN-dependent NADH-azo compound oxidoreductase; AltName: Full=FMN-dependent NADH-azoreductase [Xanthomonas oryzae pv. oryzae MAFF 311018]AQU45245.1 FMN-dependent NADH-azoreductase [Xanthomonas oryzae pv. oryzae]AWK18336.1 FMN-dependent NADH-azoreductase [Xanthomonas oryzae pv. oryzae]AXI17592.1 FMN-dependent NADH-azoreductase [X